MTHQNEKSAWFPISLLEMLQYLACYFDGVDVFLIGEKSEAPILSGSLLHQDVRTLRARKTFKWLSLTPQVLQTDTLKSTKGNLANLTCSNVA